MFLLYSVAICDYNKGGVCTYRTWEGIAHMRVNQSPRADLSFVSTLNAIVDLIPPCTVVEHNYNLGVCILVLPGIPIVQVYMNDQYFWLEDVLSCSLDALMR